MMDGRMDSRCSANTDWSRWTQFPADGGSEAPRGAGADCPGGIIAAHSRMRQEAVGPDVGGDGSGNGGAHVRNGSDGGGDGKDATADRNLEDFGLRERYADGDGGARSGGYAPYDGAYLMEAGVVEGETEQRTFQMMPGHGWAAGVGDMGTGAIASAGVGASAADSTVISAADDQADLYRGLSLAAGIDRQPLHPPQLAVYSYFAHHQQGDDLQARFLPPSTPQLQLSPAQQQQRQRQYQRQQEHQQLQIIRQLQLHQSHEDCQRQFNQRQPPHFANFTPSTSSISTAAQAQNLPQHLRQTQNQAGPDQDQGHDQIGWNQSLHLQAFPNRSSPDAQLAGCLDSLASLSTDDALDSSSFFIPQFPTQHQQHHDAGLTAAGSIPFFDQPEQSESPAAQATASDSPLLLPLASFQSHCFALDPAAPASSFHARAEAESSSAAIPSFIPSSTTTTAATNASLSYSSPSVIASPSIGSTSETLTPLDITSPPEWTQEAVEETSRPSARSTRRVALPTTPDSPQQPMTPATAIIGQTPGRQPFTFADPNVGAGPSTVVGGGGGGGGALVISNVEDGSAGSPILVPQKPAPSPAKKRGRKPGSSNKQRGADDERPAKRPRGRPRLLERVDEASAQERRRTQIRVAQRAYRDRKDQAIIRLEAELGRAKSAKEQVIQKLIEFVDFINKSSLQEHAGADFVPRLKELTDGILQYKEERDEPTKADGGGSSDGAEDAPVIQGSWIPGSCTLGGTSPDANAVSPPSDAAEQSPEQEWDGRDGTDTGATGQWPAESSPVEMVTRPHPGNASFPAYIPDPNSPGAWLRREGPSGAPVEVSTQALALLRSSDLEMKKLPFAARLEQAVLQRGDPLEVIAASDRAEAHIRTPESLPSSERPSLSFSFPHTPGDGRYLPKERRSDALDEADTHYAEAFPVAARWPSPRTRDRALWGHSQPQGPQHTQLNGGMRAERGIPDEATYPGTFPGSRWASERDRDRAIWGHPQIPEVPDVPMDGRVQHELGHVEEEFLDAHDVDVYLNNRGINLHKQRNTASIEIDPNDFKGSFFVFADGKRTMDGTRGSSSTQRRGSLPGPIETYHPNAARAAATVHPESINTMFTDTTATGAADTGSYMATLCPAIPVRNWSKEKPGKAKLTIDINLFLKELAASAVVLQQASGLVVSFRTKDVDRSLKISTGIGNADRRL